MSDIALLVLDRPDAETVRRIGQLTRRALAADEFDSLSEHKRMELAAAASAAAAVAPNDDQSGDDGREPPGSGGREGFAAVLARRHGHPGLVGYAQVSRTGGEGGEGGGYGIELVVDPEFRDPVHGVADSLLGTALDRAAHLASRVGAGPVTVRYWAPRASPFHDRLAESHGLLPERDLLQMRRPLPVDDSHRTSVVATRPFRPGADEPGWLRANNRAFASHPEQGQWDLSTMLEREGEPWFDSAGLLIHEEGGQVAASCWTKVHTDVDPPMGEIYVISVDPDFHGRGLGRALTLAGLDHLADEGLTVGMLYVDGDNAAAVSLYRSLGFVEHHVDRAYVATVG